MPAWLAPPAVLPGLIAGVATAIPALQGADHTSPFAGVDVVTNGIVTSTTPSGFYMQDPDGDGDPATSDGIFVYTNVLPVVAAGDRVEVSGRIQEYRPGGGASSLSVTEVHPSQVRVTARDASPPVPVRVGRSGREPPRQHIDDDGLMHFDPQEDGIDFWESLEGMRVRLMDCRVVGPGDAFADCWVAAGGASGRNVRGGLTASGDDANPERVRLSDALLAQALPPLDVGDRLGDVLGVVDYRHGAFEIVALEAPRLQPAGITPEATALTGGDSRVTIAAFNAHNLGPDDSGRMPRVAAAIVDGLRAPDIVALAEIEDGSGPTDDGTVDATATLLALTDAIRAAGGPGYRWRDIPPRDGEDGGAPGSNIRVAVLFNPARVSFADRNASGSDLGTTAVATDSGAALTRSPGLVSPGDGAWINSRKPLAAELRVAGTTLFLVVCHFSSKSGSTPDFGAVQPPADPAGERRRDQARAVRDFVESIARADPTARIVVAGDFNDDWFSGTLSPLASSPHLYDTSWRLVESERYTYIFEGNGHAYDRVFVSPPLIAGLEADAVHLAAEFAEAVSDHDPMLVAVDVRTPPGGVPGGSPSVRVYPNPSWGPVVIESSGPRARVSIHDVRGRRVRSLAGGGGRVVWDGRDDRRRPVPAGAYLVRISDGTHVATKKVTRLHGKRP